MTEEKWYRFFFYIVRPFVWLLYPMKVHGREQIPNDGALVCANHSSAWDPLFLAIALGAKHPMKPMAKESLFHIFGLRKILKLIGAVSVKRGASDIGAIKFSIKALQAGSYVVLFPEGTRVKSRAEGEPKTGAAMLASRTGANVLPVYVPFKKRKFRWNHVYIGEAYKMIPAGKRATSAEYDEFTAVLMDRIYDAGDGK